MFVIDSDIKKPGTWYRIDQGARMTTGYVNGKILESEEAAF